MKSNRKSPTAKSRPIKSLTTRRPEDQKPRRQETGRREAATTATPLPGDPDDEPEPGVRRGKDAPKSRGRRSDARPKEEPEPVVARRRATTNADRGGRPVAVAGPGPSRGQGDSDGRGQPEVTAGRPHAPPPMRLPAHLPGEHTLGTGGHRCRARGRRGRLGRFRSHRSRCRSSWRRRWAPAAARGRPTEPVPGSPRGSSAEPARRPAGAHRRDGQQRERPARVVPGRLHRLFAECRNLAGRGLGSTWAGGHAGTHRCGRIGWLPPGQGRPRGTRRRSRKICELRRTAGPDGADSA